jgi:hypothetical protein
MDQVSRKHAAEIAVTKEVEICAPEIMVRLAPLVLPRSALESASLSLTSQPRHYGAPLWMREIKHILQYFERDK